MSNKKLDLHPESLDKEYNLLLKELDDLDNLFKSAKNDLDKSKNYATRSSYVFTSNQTANLISIKEKKLNIIKELGNIKKTQMDMKAKEFTTNNKIEENNTGISKDILDIYRLLNKADKTNMINEYEQEHIKNEELDYDNENIDKILNNRLKSLENKEQEKKKNTQTLPSGYSIVVTKEKEKFIIDSDYNIIEDCNYDLSLINIVKFDIVEEEEYGYDEEGNAYEVVEI